MKRAIAILLLCVFAFNAVGVVLVFKIQQRQVRRAIKSKIKKGVPESELHTIALQPHEAANLRWQNEQEFTYKGKMYDIVRRSAGKDGRMVYHCIDDQQEAQLFANLDDLIQKNNDTDNPANQMAEHVSGNATTRRAIRKGFL